MTTDELFDLWKKERPDYAPFSNDGILLEDSWETQSPKIAFILKESNDDFCDIRGRSYSPRDGNSRLFWRNLNIWSYTVKKYYCGETVGFDEARNRKEDPVGHIAYVNLKKKCENKSTSYDPDIQGYVDRDWQFIEMQLSLIDPDVLFCCGTYKYVMNCLPLTVLGTGLYQSQGRIVIDFYHPSGRVGYKARYDCLCEILKNLPTTPRKQSASLSN